MDTENQQASETLEEGILIDKKVDPSATEGLSPNIEVLERIGKGGMSTVFKARHLVMNKLVAIKVLLPHLSENANIVKRFQQEASATASLNHPNIVRVYDCGITSDGRAYLMMDLLSGDSLQDLIASEVKLAPERAVEIFIQMADGLDHAHQNGVVHRDLKPSNIMLIQDKHGFDLVKIVDFGIAKIVSTDDGGTIQSLTQTGEVFGSPLYMSPEQCMGKKLDKRSDIYSMGCLMYECLNGQPPLVGNNVLDTMQKHVAEYPAVLVPSSAPDSLLRRLNTIIFKCMAKDPVLRYQSMEELGNDLKSAALSSKESWKGKEKRLKAGLRKNSNLKLSLIAIGLATSFFIAFFVLSLTINKPGQYSNSNNALWPVLYPAPRPEPKKDHQSALDNALKSYEVSLAIANPGVNKESVRAQQNLYMAQKYFDANYFTDANDYYQACFNAQNVRTRQSMPYALELINYGKTLYWLGNDPEAQKTLIKAEALLKKLDAASREVQYSEKDLWSQWHIQRGEPIFQFLQLSYARAAISENRAENMRKQAQALHDLFLLEYYRGDHARALYKVELGNLLGAIGDLRRRLKEDRAARHEFSDAISYLHDYPDTLALSRAHYGRALTEEALGLLEEADKDYHEAFQAALGSTELDKKDYIFSLRQDWARLLWIRQKFTTAISIHSDWVPMLKQ